MAKNYSADINLNKKELLNAALQRLAADPASPVVGQAYFNTTTNKIRTYNGATWDEYGTGNGTGNVTQASNSGSAGRLKVSAGADKTVQDYTGGAGLVKTDAQGVAAPAVPGTDYVTSGSTNTFTGKTFDANGAGNTLSNVEVADFASGVVTTTISAGSTDSQLPTAKAVWALTSTIVDAANAFTAKGGIDCSTNPNYPAANAGDVYKVTVAGRIGGASGALVTVGDTLTCWVDGTVAGTQAAVGANWTIVQSNVDAATTSTQGLVVLASLADTQAKTDATKAVTPAALATFIQKVEFPTVGNGALTSITLTHNLNTKSVMVVARKNADDSIWELDWTPATPNTVVLSFATAPANAEYTVVVFG